MFDTAKETSETILKGYAYHAMGLKICHVISSISRIGAGVSKAVRDLSQAQVRNGDTVTVATFKDKFTETDQPKQNNLSIAAFPVTFSSVFGYSFPLKNALYDIADSVDIIHMHGLWEYPSWVAGAAARTTGTPYIMSPHGMLEPWGLRRSFWKKKVAGLLFEYNNLDHADCLHACSEQEALNFRHYGYNGPIALAPLGLTADEFDRASTAASKQIVDRDIWGQVTDKKIVLFLSRLHEIKGLDILIEAWKNVSSHHPDWQLVIAGGGVMDYVASLKEMVRAAQLTDSIIFVGPVHGDDKWSLFKKATLFVLPTYSENFGLVVTEALACGVPVITTKGAPWSDLEQEDCGWWIDIGIDSLAECLHKTLSLQQNQLAEMGRRGRHLVESKYVIAETARSIHEVYEWILNSTQVPKNIMRPVSR